MDLSQNSRSKIEASRTRRSLGGRLFARFGTIVISGGVLFVAIASIGFLGWAMIWLFG
jgi:hypothetical protein